MTAAVQFLPALPSGMQQIDTDIEGEDSGEEEGKLTAGVNHTTALIPFLVL